MRFSTRLTRALMALATVVALAACSMPSPENESATTPQAESATLQVSAAATLKGAFEELAPLFETENPDIEISFNFGTSGALQRQIEGGAPVDLFASAGPRQMNELIDGGFVSSEKAQTICGNDLAVLVAADRDIIIGGAEDLWDLDRLTTGNLETTPAGQKAREWLESVGVWEKLEPSFVYAENAPQAVGYVSSGEADAAVIFASEAVGKDGVKVAYLVPRDQVPTLARYVAAPVDGAERVEAAQLFLDFVLSEPGQTVMAKWGFVPIEELPAR